MVGYAFRIPTDTERRYPDVCNSICSRHFQTSVIVTLRHQRAASHRFVIVPAQGRRQIPAGYEFMRSPIFHQEQPTGRKSG